MLQTFDRAVIVVDMRNRKVSACTDSSITV